MPNRIPNLEFTVTLIEPSHRLALAQRLRAVAEALEAEEAVWVSGGAVLQPMDDGVLRLESNLEIKIVRK